MSDKYKLHGYVPIEEVNEKCRKMFDAGFKMALIVHDALIVDPKHRTYVIRQYMKSHEKIKP